MTATTIRRSEPTFNVRRDILPIFVISPDDGDVLSYEGTAFLVRAGILVTCWHCVNKPLRSGLAYAVAVQGETTFHHLENIERDASGLDLATANVEMVPSMDLRLAAADDVLAGQEVMTFGYPLGTVTQGVGDAPGVIAVPGRLLQGYVTRTFTHRLSAYPATPAIELDMPAPAGVSGAPLLIRGSRALAGVLYGANAVAQVEELASIDPVTGARLPEIQRIVTFGVAHHVASLSGLRGVATGYRPLAELMT